MRPQEQPIICSQHKNANHNTLKHRFAQFILTSSCTAAAATTEGASKKLISHPMVASEPRSSARARLDRHMRPAPIVEISISCNGSAQHEKIQHCSVGEWEERKCPSIRKSTSPYISQQVSADNISVATLQHIRKRNNSKSSKSSFITQHDVPHDVPLTSKQVRENIKTRSSISQHVPITLEQIRKKNTEGSRSASTSQHVPTTHMHRKKNNNLKSSTSAFFSQHVPTTNCTTKLRKKINSNCSTSAPSSSEEDEEEGSGTTTTLFSSRSFSSDSDFYHTGERSRRAKTMKATRRPPILAGLHRQHTGTRLSTKGGEVKEAGSSFAVVKQSSDPYGDFRRSMVEMVVERELRDERELERLLRSYLALNSARHHEAIIEAFGDIWQAIFGKNYPHS